MAEDYLGPLEAGVKRAAKRIAGRTVARTIASGRSWEEVATETERAVGDVIRRKVTVPLGRPFPKSMLYKINRIRHVAAKTNKLLGPMALAVAESGRVNQRLNSPETKAQIQAGLDRQRRKRAGGK